MGHITKVQYNGKEVWVADYSGLEFDQIAQRLELTKQEIISSQSKDIRLLDVVQGIRINNDTIEGLKSFAAEVKPYLREDCYGAVGVTGFVRSLVSMLKVLGIVNVKLFSNQADALDYLTSR